MVDKTFSQLAEEAQILLDTQAQEIQSQKKGLDLRAAKVKKSERDIAEKEKQLAEWEAALTKQYDEVSRIKNAVRLETKASEAEERANMTLEQAELKLKEANQAIKQAELMREEILDREERCTAREKDMRERIRQELAGGLLKSFTGK